MGDLVAPSVEIAQRAVEKAGVTLQENFDGEFAAKIPHRVRIEWKRMAGDPDREVPGDQLRGPRPILPPVLGSALAPNLNPVHPLGL